MMFEQRFDRGVSQEFMAGLQSGQFASLLALAAKAKLDVQIRERYLNFYHHGLSVLKLSEKDKPPRYRAEIHWKYLYGIELPDALKQSDEYQWFGATEQFLEAYLRHLPAILSNADRCAKPEATAEQLMIRASHCDGSPVIFIDRQVQAHGRRRKADLVGLTTAGQFVIIEVKQGLDPRIQHVLGPIAEYHSIMAGPDGRLRCEFVHSYRKVVEQKQSLGLLPENMRPLDERAQVACLLVLYAYKSDSKLLAMLAETSAAHSLPVSFVMLPEGAYTLPPIADWERLCPVR